MASTSSSRARPSSSSSSLKTFVDTQPFVIDELWTDFEVKDMDAGATASANSMHALMQEQWPTFRYAGCEPRDEPYFSESCRDFVAGAPGVVVQAANTYWSTTVSEGWYGGFATLLEQEIDDIGEENGVDCAI